MGRWRRRALEPGIYDEIVSDRLARELSILDPKLLAVRHALAEREDVRGPLTALVEEALDLVELGRIAS